MAIGKMTNLEEMSNLFTNEPGIIGLDGFTPVQQKTIHDIYDRQNEIPEEGHYEHCENHDWDHPGNQFCLWCLLGIEEFPLGEIAEIINTPPKNKNEEHAIITQENVKTLLHEISITSYREHMLKQDKDMEEADEVPALCAKHEWWHPQDRMCVHCQMGSDETYWMSVDFISKKKTPPPFPTTMHQEHESNKHRYLDDRYSIMPKGTKLTWEEIDAKMPKIREHAPTEIKHAIDQLLDALRKHNAIRMPSHIYWADGNNNLTVVWFDPHNNVGNTYRIESKYKKSPLMGRKEHIGCELETLLHRPK